ncbi:MAG: oligosaccharide flippase family protein [Ferruginibacter sp.]
MAHELKNKLVYQIITSVSQVLLPLVSYPYITRILGPENIGKVNYVDFLVQMFMIFASFGVPFYGIREIARVRKDAVQKAIVLKEISVLLCIFSFIAACFFIAITYPAWKNNTWLYLIGLLNIILSAFSFEWYLQGSEEFRFVAARSLLVRSVMLAAFFVLVKTQNDYVIYYAIFAAGLLLSVLLNLLKILSGNNLSSQPLNYKRHLVPLWHFFLTSSAISIYIYFDTILLKQLTQSNAAVGYYTVPLKIIKIFQLALLSAGVVLLPRVSYLVAGNNMEGVNFYLSKFFNLLIVIGLPACTGIFLLAPEITGVIAGDEFIPAVKVLRILAFLPLIIGLSNLFAFQVLVPFKKEKQFLIAVLTGCIISIGINLLFIPVLKEQGAAFSNLITEIFITIITGIYSFKILKLRIDPKIIFQSILSIIVFIPLIMFVRYLFTSQLAILCSAIVICIGCYFTLQLFVFKNSIIREIKHYVAYFLSAKKQTE